MEVDIRNPCAAHYRGDGNAPNDSAVGSEKVTGIDSNSIEGVWFRPLWEHGCHRVAAKKNLSHPTFLFLGLPPASLRLKGGGEGGGVRVQPNAGEILEAS